MSRTRLSVLLRRILAMLAAIACCVVPGCKTYDLSTSSVSEQAAKFGAYQRPKANPNLRFGVSRDAQQIEQDLGH